MALQIWLPLTNANRIQNHGLLGDLTITTTPSIISGGKLGGTLNGGGYKMSADQTKMCLNNKEFSCAFWVKVTSGAERTMFFGNDGPRQFSIFNYPTINDLHLSWVNSAGSITFSTVDSGVFPTNVWTHCCVTYNNPTVTVYINGNVLSTYSYTCDLTDFAKETQVIHSAIGRYLNDFRIYNHCLSPKEVKEISKGLVLHYKMDDECLKTANNLVTGLTGGGQCTISNNIVTISGSNSDTYFYLNTSAALTSGKTYKISCVGNFDNGKYYYFPIGGQTNTSPGQLLVKNGYCSLVFTANDTIQNNGTKIILDDTSRSAGAGTITNITLEEVNGIYDCSGFGYNGIAYGNLITDSDTSRYSSSIKFPVTTTDYIEMNNSSVFSALDNCTISWWGKYDGTRSLLLTGQDTSYYVAAGEPGFYHSNVAGTLSYYVNGVKSSSVPSYTSGQWHHYTITGVNITSWTKFLLNHYGNHTQWGIQGKISDFRIYATPLSAEDVKELYNTSAVVCDNGTVMAYSLEE